MPEKTHSQGLSQSLEFLRRSRAIVIIGFPDDDFNKLDGTLNPLKYIVANLQSTGIPVGIAGDLSYGKTEEITRKFNFQGPSIFEYSGILFPDTGVRFIEKGLDTFYFDQKLLLGEKYMAFVKDKGSDFRIVRDHQDFVPGNPANFPPGSRIIQIDDDRQVSCLISTAVVDDLERWQFDPEFSEEVFQLTDNILDEVYQGPDKRNLFSVIMEQNKAAGSLLLKSPIADNPRNAVLVLLHLLEKTPEIYFIGSRENHSVDHQGVVFLSTSDAPENLKSLSNSSCSQYLLKKVAPQSGIRGINWHLTNILYAHARGRFQ
ncbi:MAG: hypothetical protein UV73_C0013G0022 [Candidatus Gottesmanbacteria bacterium GW2011_GWA2_43_14]|uniref:Uncharacterized protein n=1 Tax=Candidatus Gottesmanbacteria bacterium GW2011_GWA2_43_14 TaxID=1618443 RepID=A0A0G1DE30_9BACT|nr:MAG: hypothetical protein UV73_C0013G0022 [Candidatus Gottesmanbacteria bacterium GW2011_GWA2_43_14]